MSVAIFQTASEVSLWETAPRPALPGTASRALISRPVGTKNLVGGPDFSGPPLLTLSASLRGLSASAVNFITITDLIGAANQIYYNTFDPITPLLVAGAIYLVFALLIVTTVRHMERRLSPWLFLETSLKEAKA